MVVVQPSIHLNADSWRRSRPLSSMQLNNELARIPGVKRVRQSAPKVHKSEHGRGSHIGCPRTHHRILAGEAEASIDHHRNATLDLGLGPVRKASSAYNTRLVDRRTNDEADLTVVPISCGLEFLLCILEGFRDIKAVKVDRSFLLSLARQRLSMTLVPRQMTTYLVILPEDYLRCPLIQILHLTFVSPSVVLMSLFSLVITAPTCALGQIARHVHLTLTPSCSLSQFPSGSHFLRI